MALLQQVLHGDAGLVAEECHVVIELAAGDEQAHEAEEGYGYLAGVAAQAEAAAHKLENVACHYGHAGQQGVVEHKLPG